MEGSIIVEERKKLGLTQNELAAMLKVSQKSISKYECGTRRPSYETLVAMSAIFGVTIDYLLGNEQPQDSSSEIPNTQDQEIEELLRYYNALDKMDQRWIMGQMVDLLRKKNEKDGESVAADTPSSLKEVK